MTGIVKLFLSQTHLKAIGLVAAEWSYTEAWLEFVIWELAGIDMEKGHAITTHLQSETRIQMLQALAERQIRDEKLNEKLSKILARTRDLRKERNDIVHALWVSSRPGFTTLAALKKKRKPTPKWLKVNARGKVELTQTLMTSAEIQACADRIAKLVEDMYGLMSEIEAHMKRQAMIKAVLEKKMPSQPQDPMNTTPLTLRSPPQK